MTDKGIDASLFPSGFTGFWRSAEMPIPAVDPGEFKKVCYAAARVLAGKVVEFQFAGVTPNFHSTLFEWGYGTQQAVLRCNRVHPIVAFCRSGDSLDAEYLDLTELADAVVKVSNWRIVSKSTLESVVDPTVLELMAPQDRYVVEEAKRRRWFGPNRTIGDIIYHYWD